MTVTEFPKVDTGKFKAKSYNGDYMKVGKLGEKIVKEWLMDHPDVIGIKDITELDDIQVTDVDLIVRLKEGGNPLVEIKWDHHLGRTGNVLVEILRIHHSAPLDFTGVLGWSLRSEARWIMYYAPSTAFVYQFKTSDLRKCLQVYTGKVRNKTQFVWVSTDEIKSTILILLPLRECRGSFKVHDVIEYSRHYFPDIDQLRMKFSPESLRW